MMRSPGDVGGVVVRQSAKRSFIDLHLSPSPTTSCRSLDWISPFQICLSIWKQDHSRPILSRSLSSFRVGDGSESIGVQKRRAVLPARSNHR
ncbi:unnamed protein product [Linum trigynum]|uniref:Uncharacterized protein n=1 Tax=Linum trigynum TaxID=586398 RepID=A0AAV2E197_9ROSI